jgi:hypothetical protein
MPDQEPKLIIRGLSRRQQFNLLDHVSAECVEFPEYQSLKPGEFGDPATIVAIVSLTSVTLAGIFAWLAKEGAKIEFDATIKAPAMFNSELKIDLKLGGIQTKDQLYKELLEKGIKIPEFMQKEPKRVSTNTKKRVKHRTPESKKIVRNKKFAFFTKSINNTRFDSFTEEGWATAIRSSAQDPTAEVIIIRPEEWQPPVHRSIDPSELRDVMDSFVFRSRWQPVLMKHGVSIEDSVKCYEASTILPFPDCGMVAFILTYTGEMQNRASG